MKKWEISALQAGMLIPGTVSITGHALAASYFLETGGRDTWMAGLFALPPALISIWALNRLNRLFPGQTQTQYLPKVLGWPGYLLALLYLLYYLLVVVFTMRLTVDWLLETILPETPPLVMHLLYMIAVLYAARAGLDVLARINQFTLPVLTALGFLVSLGTAQAKDYTRLTPLFEYGLGPVLATTFLVLGHYGEGCILAMFSAYVNPKQRPALGRAHMLGLLYVALTMAGPLAGSVATLGYQVAENMPYPTFQHWLMINIARFFERTDLLAVHQWLAGIYVRVGVYLLLAVEGARQLTGIKLKRQWLLAAAAAGVVVASFVLFPQKRAFDLFVRSLYLPIGVVMGILTPPLVYAVAYLRGLERRRRREVYTHGR